MLHLHLRGPASQSNQSTTMTTAQRGSNIPGQVALSIARLKAHARAVDEEAIDEDDDDNTVEVLLPWVQCATPCITDGRT